MGKDFLLHLSACLESEESLEVFRTKRTMQEG
jgi:hypothetical protein